MPARTSSFYFKGRQATLGEIGAALNVSNVLEGSVRKSGSRREEADRMLDGALKTDSVVNGAAYQVALVYAARGDADEIFQWLDRALRQRDAGMHWMKYDPMLQPWKNDPRFKSLLARMKQG